jgi:hypothetical protein
MACAGPSRVQIHDVIRCHAAHGKTFGLVADCACSAGASLAGPALVESGPAECDTSAAVGRGYPLAYCFPAVASALNSEGI